MVSCTPVAKATLSLVPTPSVPLTSTGSLDTVGTRQSPAKPPTSAMTSAMRVAAASGLMRSTSSSPASMSTPDCLVRGPRNGTAPQTSTDSYGAGPCACAAAMTSCITRLATCA